MLKVDLGPFCVIELSLSRGGEDAEDESIVHGPVDTKTRLQLIGERLDGVGLRLWTLAGGGKYASRFPFQVAGFSPM